MNRFRFTVALTALWMTATTASRSDASFHLWTFSEFYSNDDGSVQFIELFSPSSGETVASGAEIRTTSGNNVFSFPGNLTGDTLNKHLLIATPDFALLPGAVTPDYTLPATNFFDSAGDTVRLYSPLFSEFHFRTFASTPTDGVMSLNFPGPTSATNSPTNFAGDMGSIDLSPPGLKGDYNENNVIDAADYTVWRDAMTAGSMTLPNDASPGSVGDDDFNYWRDHFGETLPVGAGEAASAAVPEPTTLVLLALGALVLTAVRRAARHTSGLAG